MKFFLIMYRGMQGIGDLYKHGLIDAVITGGTMNGTGNRDESDILRKIKSMKVRKIRLDPGFGGWIRGVSGLRHTRGFYPLRSPPVML